MRTSEQYYIYKQLEPNDVLITGNAKKHKPLFASIEVLPPVEELTEEEHNKRQDEYLASKGININPKAK